MTTSISHLEAVADWFAMVVTCDRDARRQLARNYRRFERLARMKLERDARRFGWLDLGGEG